MKLKPIFATTLLAATSLLANGERIAVLSDVHVTPGNANETMLRMAVEEINAADFDFVVMNGDLTNEGSDEQLRNVKGILDGIRHPLYVLPGNHENNWSQSATKTFHDLWGNDRFYDEYDSLIIVGIN
ncbi:MAG: metallophosphoesterase, partial [Muribaculaceae bacterium]|nr:metallophosphoesterase [Muribaculaceae bacterium]